MKSSAQSQLATAGRAVTVTPSARVSLMRAMLTSGALRHFAATIICTPLFIGSADRAAHSQHADHPDVQRSHSHDTHEERADDETHAHHADEDHPHVTACHGCVCDGHYHARFAPHDAPPPFGFSLSEGWFDEWHHSHFSRLGTPQVHFFFTEPAYPERDLFVDFVYTRTAEGKEYEVATELEWAFTRRIGVVIEVPGIILDSTTGPQQEGFGDLVVAPRFLLADFDRFMMSFNLEVSTPTGDEERGFGAGEVILGPSFTGWYDLGNWWTSGFRVGVETGVDSRETEMAYDLAIARTFCGPALFGHCCRQGHAGHGHSEYGSDEHGHSHNGHNGHEDDGHHFPPGMTSLIAEINGRTLTAGDEEGRSTAELLFGVSYCLTERMQVRVGYQFPLFKPRDLEERIVTGMIWHF